MKYINKYVNGGDKWLIAAEIVQEQRWQRVYSFNVWNELEQKNILDWKQKATQNIYQRLSRYTYTDFEYSALPETGVIINKFMGVGYEIVDLEDDIKLLDLIRWLCVYGTLDQIRELLSKEG